MRASFDQQLAVPHNAPKVLVHACCAPCTGSILEQLIKNGIEPTIFFDNSNISPEEEYSKRCAEIHKFAKRMKVPFFESQYNPQLWLAGVKGLENVPERGKRCIVCFDMRLERTAAFAAENGFTVFTSTLGLSRWKDFETVCACGRQAASKYPDVVFWEQNWRKNGGSQRASEISKEQNFYRQKYCGCIFSLPSVTRYN